MDNLFRNCTVLIIDYGSKYSQLIMRRIQSLSILCFYIRGPTAADVIERIAPRAIVVSGCRHSLHPSTIPYLSDEILEYAVSHQVYVLGICYGMELLVQRLGGEFVSVGDEYKCRRIEIEIENASFGGLFGNKSNGDKQVVWMNHGDETVKLPKGFQAVARSQQGSVAAIVDKERRFYGLNYHPEVTDTPEGMETLKHFMFDVCGIIVLPNWSNKELWLNLVMKITKRMVGPEDHVICALFGCVTSTVAATLFHKAIGDKLHCIFVDNGLLRYKEREQLMETFERDLHLPVTCVDASEQFLSQLKGVVDLEKKKDIIGKEFVSVIDAFALDLKQKLGKKLVYLIQGNLYIESFFYINNHRLLKDMDLKVIEQPLKPSFKDKVIYVLGKISSCLCQGSDAYPNDHFKELPHNAQVNFKDTKRENAILSKVRAVSYVPTNSRILDLGRILNIPETFLKFHPFPCSGLAVRVLGDVTEGNALDILRQVDEIFIQSIKDAGIYDSISQAFAELLPIESGVEKNSHVVALRAITSENGMSADWYNFEHKFLDDVARKICNNVVGVNRVFQDITSEPSINN